jgi:serine/threonine protein kinase/formylglycine-generating enzyme required for sulfatase activity
MNGPDADRASPTSRAPHGAGGAFFRPATGHEFLASVVALTHRMGDNTPCLDRGEWVTERRSKSGETVEATLPPDPEAPPGDSEPARVSTQELTPDDSQEASPEPADGFDVLPVGAKVGRYLVVERLGAGAMGVVYAAYDPKLDRKVALKLLRPHAGGDQMRRAARLEREAKAVAKLSHPNVVGIFDVLVEDEHLVLAMEYLGGGTLTRWLTEKKRPWREILRMFIEVGRGLAAAHAEGQIHRDFKPDNVLLDKSGVPKVVDFGLVRFSSGAGPQPSAEEITSTLETYKELAASGAAGLTRTGAIAGTPAYMAPEQFMAKPVDGRTDQFAFCVALYQALYGERPFEGNTAIQLAASVTAGHLRTPPKNSEVPGWVRACVMRGLRIEPDERFSRFDDLLAVLTNDPVARRNRRLAIGVAAVVLLGGTGTGTHVLLRRQRSIDRQVAGHIAVADSALSEAAVKRDESEVLAARAFSAFDTFQPEEGETLWAEGLSAAQVANADYQRGIRRLEAAVTLAPRRDLKARIADALFDNLNLQVAGRAASERAAVMRQLSLYDEGGKRTERLAYPATLKIETTPSNLAATIDSYDPDTHGLSGSRPAGRTPLLLSLPPGSYRLNIEATSTHVGFRYPVMLAAGETLSASIPVPARTSVPEGFIYVPAGRSKFGSANEELRSGFLETVPIHDVTTPAFLIARAETTLGQWIEFLDSLPPASRAVRLPRGSAEASGGIVGLRKTAEGRWEYSFRATDLLYRAVEGQPFVYRGRKAHVSQDWRRFPVSGVSAEDAIAFSTWLAQTGRVPNARLCLETEWERAARGADGREYPHGDLLAPSDANFDLTYGRQNAAYGPDEVGAHPVSTSPVGCDDMVGNVWEITRSTLDRDQFVIRGGSFYQFRPAQRSSNRQAIAAATRDHTIGFRICATPTSH